MIAPTKHAFTIKADNDAEILVHIGLKHNLDERHFNYHVNVNETVNPDTAIVSLNDEAKEMLGRCDRRFELSSASDSDKNDSCQCY